MVYGRQLPRGLTSSMQAQYLTDPRLLMAQEIMRAGGSAAPVSSPLEGIARMLQGAVGGYQSGKVKEEYQARGKDYNDAIAQALAGQDPMSALKTSENPDVQELVNQLTQKDLENKAELDNKVAFETDPRVLDAKIRVAAAGATGLQKPPSGYQYTSDNSLAPIPGGPSDPAAPNNKKFTPEQAGKVSMVKNAATAMSEVKSSLFDESGKLKSMKDLINANLNTPGTKGRQIRNLLSNAVEAQLRSETGAAATQSEIDRMIQRFLPSPLDNETTKLQKVEQLQGLLKGTLSAAGVPANQIPNPTPETALDASDPRIAQARAAGYSDEEITQFLNKGR